MGTGLQCVTGAARSMYMHHVGVDTSIIKWHSQALPKGRAKGTQPFLRGVEQMNFFSQIFFWPAQQNNVEKKAGGASTFKIFAKLNAYQQTTDDVLTVPTIHNKNKQIK